MKKTLALVLALVLMLGMFAACGTEDEPEDTTPDESKTEDTATPEVKDDEEDSKDEDADDEEDDDDEEEAGASNDSKVIAGIVFQEDQFFKLLSSGYSAAADDRGYEIQLTNTNNDQSKETEALNTYIAQKIAGVAISPLNTQVSPASIEAAHDAGLKVAICNASMETMPFAVASYSADNVAFCKQTGEMAVEFIKENYPEDHVVKLGIVQFKTQVPEQSTDRVNGFLEALDDAEIEYEIVSDQDAWLQDMAVATVGDMLSANPDIDIIFAANEGGTVGTTMAVDNAGNAGKTFVFGSDASEQIVGLLKDDNDILQAVTGQDPFAIGYATVEALIDSIEGNDVEGAGELNIIPGIPLSRDNESGLDDFLDDLQSKM